MARPALPRITSPSLKHLGTSRILIAYDRDEAGNQAAEQLAKSWRLRVRLLPPVVPQGHGCQCVCTRGPPASKSLGIVIRSAQWMGPGDPPQSDLPLAAEPCSQLRCLSRLFLRQLLRLLHQQPSMNWTYPPLPFPGPGAVGGTRSLRPGSGDALWRAALPGAGA